jgi:hypothetical protein
LSNEDIWKGNKSLDDSKNFIKNFQVLEEKKKISSHKKSNKMMSRKPNHLSVNIK